MIGRFSILPGMVQDLSLQQMALTVLTGDPPSG